MKDSQTNLKKIAVLGGGMASLTSVFDLTSAPDWAQHYEITVYQMGWRLGGKGASSRNAEIAQRIEEHGLHIFMGFYENAFQIMRQCYQELGRDETQPMSSWDEAFKPQNFLPLPELSLNQSKIWPYEFAANDLLPGNGLDFPSVWGNMRLLLDFMVEQTDILLDLLNVAIDTIADGENKGQNFSIPKDIAILLASYKIELKEIHQIPQVSSLYAAKKLADAMSEDWRQHSPEEREALAWLLRTFKQGLWEILGELVSSHDKFRRLWLLLDLAQTTITGVIADNLIDLGFAPADEFELREWLTNHGASHWATQSSVIRGLYDLALAYENGDVERPNLAAGGALRCALRMILTYRGALLWKMQAGMGEIIFAPLYEVLHCRGVKFKFFHRVKNLGLSEDSSSIRTISISRQATLNGSEYNPLIEVKGLPCWPNNPLYEQLVEGATLQHKKINLESSWNQWGDIEEIQLNAGEDFDLVIFGISLAAIPHIFPEALTANHRWSELCTYVKTNQTQALQVWMKPSLKELGWYFPSPVLVSFEHPYNSWGDMTHLINKEDWDKEEEQPLTIAYFCGPLIDCREPYELNNTALLHKADKQAGKAAIEWFRENLSILWPNLQLTDSGEDIDWNQLIDPQGGEGTERFTNQYFRGNAEPTERYVLSVKGSTKYRIKGDESGFDNLYVVGDWTLNGINMGCIESAVISGRQVSHAISGYPKIILGETDFGSLC